MTDPRARLRELEKRLKDEPENLGLRVTVAGILRDAGRGAEAVELYRSVAIAYRDQGRSQQAIAVCKSILELAPDDARCHALLEALVAKAAPASPIEADDVEPLPPQPAAPPSTRPHAVAAGTTPGTRAHIPTPIPAPPPKAPTLPPNLGTPPPRPVTPPPAAATVPLPKPPVVATPPPKPLTPPTPLPRVATKPGPEPETPRMGAEPLTPRPKPVAVGTTPPTAKRRAQTPLPEAPRKKPDSGTAHVIRRDESAPARRSPFDATPLPTPMPYHVAEPTTANAQKISEADLPVAEGAETRPGSEPGTRPEMTGIANAARRISASLIASTDASGLLVDDDVSAELDTRQLPRIESSELLKIEGPPPTVPTERIELDFEEGPTSLPRDTPLSGVPNERDSEDERTRPRDMRFEAGEREDELATSPLFVALPARQRSAVLARFGLRLVKAGVAVIRQGETGHPLVVVVHGKLNMICEKVDGSILAIGNLGPGEFVGEAALLAHVPSPVQVIAVTDVELRVLPANELYEIAGAFPAMWAALRDAADRRTRELEAKLRG